MSLYLRRGNHTDVNLAAYLIICVNFDETGFQMGMIAPGMVVTRADRRVRAKAIQPGNRE